MLASTFWCIALVQLAYCLSLPTIVPAVDSWTAGAGTFTLSHNVEVLVDSRFQSARDENGLTLVPPTLQDFAQTFTSDLHSLFPEVSARLATSTEPKNNSIFLTIDQATRFTLAKGAPTSEGYILQINKNDVVVAGASPLGVWRGVTTLLQGLVQGIGSLPMGRVVDQPDWATRGIMLDCGRQWYPISYLKEMCAYLSFFKASEFHLHLSDNLPGRVTGPLNSTYARFRLHTNKLEFAGLSPHVNETYSREEFDDLQRSCAGRGVTIVPEIEAPGHALVITQWKPQLALPSDPTLLNLSIPETIQTMKDIWAEFLPWLHSKQVSIGADEYSSALADDYLRFVANMSEFIQATSNKTIRSWGTNEPSPTGLQLTRNTTVQHWDGSEDNAFQLIRQGYQVINSDDAFLYIVMKQSGSFPQRLNQTRLWRGNARGGAWDPTQFNRTLSSSPNNPDPTATNLIGGIMAVWNDQGPTASTPLEAFYSFKMGLPVVAASSWRAATRSNALTQLQFNTVYPLLERTAPGQNLDRRVKSKGPTVVQYDFTKGTGPMVQDQSGNGYDARLGPNTRRTTDGVRLPRGSSIDSQLGSKGANYTLLLTFAADIHVTSQATLLSGSDTALVLAGAANGSTTFAFVSSNITYPLFDYTLPVGSGVTDVVLQGTEDRTAIWVNGTSVGDFEVVIRNSALRRPMAFVAPIGRIGGDGFTGLIRRFMVVDGLQNVTNNQFVMF